MRSLRSWDRAKCYLCVDRRRRFSTAMQTCFGMLLRGYSTGSTPCHHVPSYSSNVALVVNLSSMFVHSPFGYHTWWFRNICVLANKLSKVMDYLLVLLQSAFIHSCLVLNNNVGTRQIVSNILKRLLINFTRIFLAHFKLKHSRKSWFLGFMPVYQLLSSYKWRSVISFRDIQEFEARLPAIPSSIYCTSGYHYQKSSRLGIFGRIARQVSIMECAEFALYMWHPSFSVSGVRTAVVLKTIFYALKLVSGLKINFTV